MSWGLFSRKGSILPQGIRKDTVKESNKRKGRFQRVVDRVRNRGRSNGTAYPQQLGGSAAGQLLAQPQVVPEHSLLEPGGAPWYDPGKEDSGFEVIDRHPTTIKHEIEIHSTPSTNNVLSRPRVKGDEHSPQHDDTIVVAEIRETELRREFEELTTRLKTQEEAFKLEAAKAEQHSVQSKILQREVESLRTHAQDFEAKEAALKTHLREYESIVNILQEENRGLQGDLKENEEKMAAYRTDIAKLSDERPDASRDDDHWEKQVSLVFRSVESWVLKYYLTIDPQFEDLSPLSPLFREFLTIVLGDDATALTLLNDEPLYVVQAYIAFQLRSHILEPTLLGLVRASYEKTFEIIASCTEPEELVKWRLSTLNIITRRDDFWKAVSTKEEELATEIVTSLAALIPDHEKEKYNPSPRTKKLKGIVSQASKMAIDLQKEPSTISYPHFQLGERCLAATASDAKGLRKNEELESQEACVLLTVYPAAIRTGYNNKEGVVIVKAKVLASEPAPQES